MAQHAVIIGAGPAGLTAAYLLSTANVKTTVIEGNPKYVGGISRTEEYQGFCFDIGGHRFFTKSDEIMALWHEMLPHNMQEQKRLSRIYYNGKLFSYPLRPFDVLRKLGILTSLACMLSYLKACLLPIKNPKTFEDWIINHFGRKLFVIFFKSYTEKVWGISCREISADWAAQRIKGLSLSKAIINMLFHSRPSKKKKSQVIKTLIESFYYPPKGPGMLWHACADKIRAHGGEIILGARVAKCSYQHDTQNWIIEYVNQDNDRFELTATAIISSAPLKELVTAYLRPQVDTTVMTAATKLKYRDFIVVALIVNEQKPLPDNWLYIHDPRVKVARIQNFRAWSEEMVPNKNQSCYGMEYFCQEDDSLWNTNDQELIKNAAAEFTQLGLGQASDVVDGYVIRQPKAYPVYTEDYAENVAIIRKYLAQNFPNLHLVGRNGMHKYNNQDHAMMTAMLTVKNIIANKNLYDVWQVNQDAEYHETIAEQD